MANTQRKKATVYLQHGQQTQATEILAPALEKLQQLYASTPTDIYIRSALVDALLLSADVSPYSNTGIVRSQCKTVLNILKPVVNDSANFQILAPWVKANACLNQHESAAPIQKQLEAMPYNDPGYLYYLSTHSMKRENS